MAFIHYAVQSAIIMAVFCSAYHLFFRRLTFFTINRFFLIFSLLLSLAIPLVKVEVEDLPIQDTIEDIKDEYGADVRENVFVSQVVDGTMPVLASKQSSKWKLYPIIRIVYFAVSCFLLLRLFYAILSLCSKARYGEKENGFIFIKPFARFSNCSFFNLLIVDKEKLSDFELQQVLAHEKEHQQRFHSIDQLIIEALLAIFWFNPFIYYYKKAINAVHEYEVDQALSVRIDKESYGNLLLKLAAPSSPYLTHGFSQNSLRSRIKFLFGKRSNRFKKIGYTLLVPLLVVIVSIFSFQKVEAIGTMMNFPASPKVEPVPIKEKIRIDKSEEDQSSTSNRDLNVLASLKLSDVIKPVLAGDLDIDGLLNDKKEAADGEKLTVVLDPGHGGDDNASSFQNVYEKDLVLQIAMKMKAALESDGFNVLLTRDADKFVRLKDRVAVKGDIFVSIHANISPKKFESTNMSGMEILVPNKWGVKDSLLFSKSLSLAASLQYSLSSLEIGMREDFKEISLFVLNNNSKPAVVLELGYMNNPNDFKLLTNEVYQNKLAGSLSAAVKKYQAKL